MLFSWGGSQRSEAHHFGWVPQRLLQVPSLNVTLKVSQPQYSQVQRVCGDTRQARPFLLRSHDPVIMRISVVFIVLKVITRRVWIGECVGLEKGGETGRVYGLVRKIKAPALCTILD